MMKRQDGLKKFFLYLPVILSLVAGVGVGGALGADNPPPQIPATPVKVYLPFVYRTNQYAAGPQTIPFGVESSYIDSNLLNKAEGVDASWWRYFAFSWQAIEPNDVAPSEYNWNAVKEEHLISAAQNGFKIVATVRNTPKWAQAINDPQSIPCSPIKDDTTTRADFVEFVTTVVQRYSQPPYNIKYWQFGNEPDVAPENLLDGELYTAQFGCWGVMTDPLYGGEKFGKFLALFSQTAKAVDPEAKVTNGGLLLDCDPTVGNPNCQNGNFFEGMLRGLQANGGFSSIDYVSFHAYVRWYSFSDLDYDEGDPGFIGRGGVFVGKVNFLREMMTTYGIDPPKPILVTEGGLLCNGTLVCNDPLPPDDFSNDQADLVVRNYVRAIDLHVSGFMWYTLNYQPWRHNGLLWSDGTGKPAYTAYHFMVSQIGSATYVGKLETFWPDLRAYEFTRGSQRVWVVWSPDQTDHTIEKPAGFVEAYDKLGNRLSVPPSAQTITVNGPVYLILN
jgi:hypothetical protein